MNSILITGCNRGLGLGLLQHLVKEPNPPVHLIATCRDVQAAEELCSIAECHKNIRLLQFDLRNFDKYEELAEQVSDIVGNDGLNVLFNNAGVSPKFTRLGLVKVNQMMDSFTVNTVAPVMLTKALLPLLKKASSKNSALPLGVKRAAVINMTSVLGSIQMNETGGLFPYRCSKAALNMATRTMSLDLQNNGILVTCVHPGWVKTDMGGPNAPLDINESISGIIKLMHVLGEKHNGCFYQYDGQPLSW